MEYKDIYIPSLKRKVLTRILNAKENKICYDQILDTIYADKPGAKCIEYIQTTAGLTFGPEAYESIYGYKRNFDTLCKKLKCNLKKKKNLEAFMEACIDMADAKSNYSSLEQFRKNIKNSINLFITLIMENSGEIGYKKKKMEIDVKSITGEITNNIIKLWDMHRHSVFINSFPVYGQFIFEYEGRKKKETKDMMESFDTEIMANSKKPNKIEPISESKVKNLEEGLKKTVKGQDHALKEIADTLYLRTGGISEKLPVIYIFLGPTGVGKTYLTRELNNYLFDRNKKLFEMSGSNFYEKHMISKLIGSPAGYIGYDHESGLAKHVKENPGPSIILFDEFEKAHSSIWDIILTYADIGIIQDAKNNDLDLSDTIMIMTGNVGNADFKTDIGMVTGTKNKQVEKHIKTSLESLLRPELRGRVNVVYFNNLSDEAKRQILDLEIGYAMKRVENKRGLKLEVSDRLKDYLLKQGFDEKKGARGLKNMLREKLFVPLGRFIVQNDLKNSKINSDYDENVKFYLASQNKSQF